MFNSAFLLLALPIIANCHVPADPRALEPPPSIQLRPDDVVKKSFPPFGSSGRGRTGSIDANSFKALQLNLCNSGFAGCFRGGDSIPEGGELIYNIAPNVVTVNEVCSNDVAQLRSYLAEAWPEDYTYTVFMPAIDKRNNAAYKCKNSFSYGSGVIGRVAASRWQGLGAAYGGKYASQDSKNELRTFACASATGDHFACTTHLSSDAEPIALAQCKALMFDAVPYLKGLAGTSGRTVVGGDFNLEYDTADPENVQKCVPNGYARKGDGDVQHVIFSNDLRFDSTKLYGLTNTDHDGFLVRLTTS